MAYTTLYSFYEAGRINRVYYDPLNPSFIDYNTLPATSGPTRPSDNTPLGNFCGGTTKYEYRVQSAPPYAYYKANPNDPFCGYVPPVCDITEICFTVTDETNTDANDATINLFTSSTKLPITYTLYKEVLSPFQQNETGYFKDLEPAFYIVKAVDATGCTITKEVQIVPYDDSSLTHWKYKLDFETIDKPGIEKLSWQVRLYDMRNNYDITQYPKDVVGTGSPLKLKQQVPSESKDEPIISRNYEINLIYDGITFNIDEFTTAPEKQWKVEVYKNSKIDFIGWLLPDETKDQYADPKYDITLTATDGIPSLKGNLWGNGTGGNGYSTDQIPQFQLMPWNQLLKQCLDQIGYNYGNLTILSSLMYNNTYDVDLWTKFATWSDLMYGTDGVPNSTYECLEKLLRGVKLSILQHEGRFVLINWNDLYYFDKSISLLEYGRAFYTIDVDNITASNTGVTQPVYHSIGYDQPYKPMGNQTLNYDKVYNIKGNVDFSILSLLYPNPSFEIGSTEGAKPSGWDLNGTIQAFLHQDDTAYDGKWELRTVGATLLKTQTGPVIQDPGSIFFMADNERSISIGYDVDQSNKKLNMSFVWRPIYYSDDENVVPSLQVYFFPLEGGSYIYSLSDNKWYIAQYNLGFTPYFQGIVEDYIAWNSFSISTEVFPGTGIGRLSIAIKAPFRVAKTGVLIVNQGNINHTIDYDNFELTLGDGSDTYSKQQGETHLTTLVTNPAAEQKEVELPLFTYPNNKRIAGNIFTDTPYINGEVDNKWNFALKTNDKPDRLPATITKAIARNYSRPMYIFEGELIASYIAYYGVFKLRWYEDRIFRAFSIELDARNATGSVTLVEIDDRDAQFVYKYVGKFEKSAKKNINS